MPKKLPHAHLYLDDVEEICSVFNGLFNPPRPIQFSTDDLEFDSIEDLEKHAGSTTDFTIEVGDFAPRIRITSFLQPAVDIYGVHDEQLRWGTYGKIENIFRARQYTLKNAILGLPEWLKWSLYGIWMISIVAITPPHYARYYYYGTSIGLFVFVLLVLFRPTRVSFVRIRERSRVLSESRKTWVKTVVLLILGAVIGKLVEHFVAHWWAK